MTFPATFVQTGGRFCVLALVGLLLLTGCHSPPSLRLPVTLRVMTYNIRHGEGLDGKVDLPRLAEVIRREAADVVLLQEVDKGVRRTAGRDLTAELAALTGLTGVFSNNFSFQGGEYGNAILTRFPVKRWTNTHYRMLRPNEQRGLLEVVLDVHGREVVCLATHIDYRGEDSERLANVAQMREVLARHAGRPFVLGGDFNDHPASRTHQRLAEFLDDTWARVGTGDGFTFPAGEPRSRIDYLWIPQDGTVEPLRAWVPASEASDHRPLVGEFRLK